jgi:hypothetical protein
VFAAVLWMPEEGLEPPTRGLCEASAKKARAEGKGVRRVEVERWTAQPTGSQAVEVATKAEAVRLADEMPGTWKHRRRGAYRVVPLIARSDRAFAADPVRTSWSRP